MHLLTAITAGWGKERRSRFTRIASSVMIATILLKLCGWPSHGMHERRIDIHREVSAHAFSTRASENLFEASSAPRDNMHTDSSSFDEPLASPLSAGLDYVNPARTHAPHRRPSIAQERRAHSCLHHRHHRWHEGKSGSLVHPRHDSHLEWNPRPSLDAPTRSHASVYIVRLCRPFFSLTLSLVVSVARLSEVLHLLDFGISHKRQLTHRSA